MGLTPRYPQVPGSENTRHCPRPANEIDATWQIVPAMCLSINISSLRYRRRHSRAHPDTLCLYRTRSGSYFASVPKSAHSPSPVKSMSCQPHLFNVQLCMYMSDCMDLMVDASNIYLKYLLLVAMSSLICLRMCCHANAAWNGAGCCTSR